MHTETFDSYITKCTFQRQTDYSISARPKFSSFPSNAKNLGAINFLQLKY